LFRRTGTWLITVADEIQVYKVSSPDPSERDHASYL
jgi:hypothetical protein